MYNSLILKFPDASLWPQDLGLAREVMHGGTFNGNSSRLLLRKADQLLNYCPRRSQLAIVQPFYDAFKAFDVVVSSCFGSELNEDYCEKINDFSLKYMKAGIPLTPKFHIWIQHVPEFIADKKDSWRICRAMQ